MGRNLSGSLLAFTCCQPSVHLVPGESGQPGQPGSSLAFTRCQHFTHVVPGEPDFAALTEVEKDEEKLEDPAQHSSDCI